MFLDLDKIEPNNIAAIDDVETKVTYGELCKYAHIFNNVIPSRSVVFLLCINNVGALVSYISMVENGIVPLLLNEDIDEELFNALLIKYKPQYICKQTHLVNKEKESIVAELAGYSYIKTNNPDYPINESLELLMSTSGSTGSPKLVRYKKGNLEANAKNVAKAWGWTNSERPICDLNMNYTMGLNVINTHLYVGATLLLISCNITEVKYWNFIKKYKATNFTGVPFSYDILWKLRFNKMQLPSLKTLSVGGGKLSNIMFKSIVNYVNENNKRFIASFGTTETAARISMLDSKSSAIKIGSIGKAIPEGKMYLIDSSGKEILESPAEGELVYTGPNVTMGYAYNYLDLRLKDDFNGVYETGDIARRDEDGYYYIIGRKSRFLKLLGYRVSLDQCEQLIKDEFGIDCACVGNDEKMIIFIKDNIAKETITQFLAKKTSLNSNLFSVEIKRELKRNKSGKILYNEL